MYPPPEKFQIRRLRNGIFITCHEISLRKIDLEYENGKQLQITIIKITESKESKSIHRLDLSGSTGPGGAAAASYGSENPHCWTLTQTDFPSPVKFGNLRISQTSFHFPKTFHCIRPASERSSQQ